MLLFRCKMIKVCIICFFLGYLFLYCFLFVCCFASVLIYNRKDKIKKTAIL